MDPVELAARLVREQVRPNLETWEREARYPREAVRGSGLTGLYARVADGGLDLSFEDGVEVFEQLGRGDAALAFSLSMHNAVTLAVTRMAGDDLRTAWGRRLAEGKALGGFSLTEPHAGSDATAITTRATETADGWLITGRKAWVSLAAEADLFLVVAKTSDEPGHRDIGMFAVEASAAGVSFPTRYRTARWRFLPVGEMLLEDVPAAVVAPPGEGMRAALGAIDLARVNVAAISNGLHAEALEIALRHARERRVFGEPVLEHQGPQWALADAETDLVAGRLLTRRGAELIGTPEGSVAVAHAKRFCPDAALRAALHASELLGAYGLLEDRPLARFIEEAKMLQVVDGTTEIQRVVIARDLVKRAEAL